MNLKPWQTENDWVLRTIDYIETDHTCSVPKYYANYFWFFNYISHYKGISCLPRQFSAAKSRTLFFSWLGNFTAYLPRQFGATLQRQKIKNLYEAILLHIYRDNLPRVAKMFFLVWKFYRIFTVSLPCHATNLLQPIRVITAINVIISHFNSFQAN
jgi:hypothetical protein